MTGELYCPNCLEERQQRILYAARQPVCVLCGNTNLVPDNDSACRRDSLTAEMILADPAASHWLTGALKSALLRDPVDAANDAEVLAYILDRHCRLLLQQIPPNGGKL
ncbi:MAG TPA: hypothetical protein VFK06_17720 [Candidatus Angelobacter sp.]|nr:hypothetical protein [Candidatus Angelobacter sp.]